MRLIDADKLIEHMYFGTEYDKTVDDDMEKTEAMCKAFKCGWNDALASVMDYAPTVDAVPVKHGHWKEVDTQYIDVTKCSNCGVVEYFNKGWKRFNYCPNCGAKMEEVEE